jgi:hypothetical protein
LLRADTPLTPAWDSTIRPLPSVISMSQKTLSPALQNRQRQLNRIVVVTLPRLGAALRSKGSGGRPRALHAALAGPDGMASARLAAKRSSRAGLAAMVLLGR